MRWSAMSTVEAAGRDDLHAAGVRRREQPDFLPDSDDERDADLEIAAAAVRIALERHAGRSKVVVSPEGRVVERSGKDLREVDLLVGSGGVLRHGGPDAVRRVLAPATGDAFEGGWQLPRDPAVVVDHDYVLAAAGPARRGAPGRGAPAGRADCGRRGIGSVTDVSDERDETGRRVGPSADLRRARPQRGRRPPHRAHRQPVGADARPSGAPSPPSRPGRRTSAAPRCRGASTSPRPGRGGSSSSPSPTLGLLWTLRYFAVITLPLAVSLLIAALAVPLVNLLRRTGMPRGPSAGIVMVLGIGTVALLLTFVGQQVAAGASDLADSVVAGPAAAARLAAHRPAARLRLAARRLHRGRAGRGHRQHRDRRHGHPGDRGRHRRRPRRRRASSSCCSRPTSSSPTATASGRGWCGSRRARPASASTRRAGWPGCR